MQGALDNFYLAIHSRYDIEKPLAKRFIRRKLDIVNRLKDENAQLKEVVRQKDEERNKLEDYLKKLATEFVILGKECEKENMKGAAINNYKNALELYPTHPEAMRRLKKINKNDSKE